MKIELHKIKISELVKKYSDNGDGGVVGFDGNLDIRPIYQREFVYAEDQRNAVIQSVRHGFPINVMYWSKSESAEKFEVLDGQQRTISICQFIQGAFSITSPDDPKTLKYFHTLAKDEQKCILDYELQVYICVGVESEKLKWFKTINIAGKTLTNQEMRNAVYAGPWVADAKRYFSRVNGEAMSEGGIYMSGSAIRQELLEEAISWASNGDIEAHMSTHQNDKNATKLRLHFKKIIDWVKATFTTYRSEMKSVDWGSLYANHHKDELDPQDLEERIAVLMMDDDVTKKSGVYAYVLDGDEKHLNVRAFSKAMKREAYERQNGICPACPKSAKTQNFELDEMEGDHIKPWHSGGKTTADNCNMLCKSCNRRKSGK